MPPPRFALISQLCNGAQTGLDSFRLRWTRDRNRKLQNRSFLQRIQTSNALKVSNWRISVSASLANVSISSISALVRMQFKWEFHCKPLSPNLVSTFLQFWFPQSRGLDCSNQVKQQQKIAVFQSQRFLCVSVENVLTYFHLFLFLKISIFSVSKKSERLKKTKNLKWKKYETFFICTE